MKKTIDKNNLITGFFNRLRKYNDFLNKQNARASIESIIQLENQYDIKLPLIYKEFLQIFNGGELFTIPGGVTFWKVYDEALTDGNHNYTSISEGNKMVHRKRIPMNFFIIADTVIGDYICIDLDKSNRTDAEITKVDHHTAAITKRWTGLIELLMHEVGGAFARAINSTGILKYNIDDIMLTYDNNGKKHSISINKKDLQEIVTNYIYNNDFQAKSYQEEGFWISKPNVPFTAFITESAGTRLHRHTFIEFVYVLDGCFKAKINGLEYEASKNDLLVINSNEYHETELKNNGNGKLIIIQFEPWLVSSNLGIFYEAKFIIPFLNKEVNYLKHIKLENHDIIEQILYEILDAFTEEKDGYELSVIGNLYKLFSLLIQNNYIQYANSNIKKNEADRLNNVLEYISKNYNKEISVYTAAKKAFMSYHHFCRVFKKVTGKTFTEYINDIKLAEAEKLLITTHDSISEIALKIGYTSVDYFYQVFKNEKGVSPRVYRSQNN